MKEDERDEILYRLDERTKRVDEHLNRLDERVEENEQTIDNIDSRLSDAEKDVNTAKGVLAFLSAGVSAIIAKVLGFFRLA
jgi:t-SNARE complex subunit (syntaxin)